VRLKTKARRGWCSRGSIARLGHSLSVLRLSRLFCEGDACPLSPQGDWGHPSISAPRCPSLDLALSPLPAFFYLESVSTLGLGLGQTARVTQICCLGRLVPDTTASLAASEILPTGSVQAPRYYAGRSLRTLRQQSEGGQTDRWLQSIPNSSPPSRMFLPSSIKRVPKLARAAHQQNLFMHQHVAVLCRAGLRTVE